MNYSWKFPIKDPQAELDYELDLAERGWLAEGETITQQNVTSSDNSLTVDRVTQANGVIRFWATGGVAGTDAFATIEFTTSAGRKDQRTVLIPIRER